MNTENSDRTTEMGAATFPTVTLTEDGRYVNTMHGYANEMNICYMRENILPIGLDRTVNYSINTYGQNIDTISFEVRKADGSGLVENTDITEYSENEGVINGSLQIKDLVDYDREYMLVFLLGTNGKTVRYYNRIIVTEDDSEYNVDQFLDFALDFSNKTFDKNIDSSELTSYLESNSEGDNTSYSYVNIHSSYSQVTWGDLNIVSHSEPELFIRDIHAQTAVVELQYQVVLGTDAGDKAYNIVEDYRIRYTSDRMYLLNYERTMNYVFEGDTKDITGDKIELSISQADIELVESDGGSSFAFVNEGRLYAYNSTNNKLARLFGFYDEKNDDARTRWQRSTIQVLGIDEGGNVTFVVSGYMNRGDYEGYVATVVYEYNSTTNAVEELVCIPSYESPEILEAYAKEFSYVSSDDTFYMIMDNNVYAVDMSDRSYKVVIDDIHDTDYKISESFSMIAWQTQEYKELNQMNLSTQTENTITAENGEYIRLIGYMGEDIVYGLVKETDIYNDEMGNQIYPMYCIKIEDGDGNVLENYEPSGILITDTTITENQIALTRVSWNSETQKYENALDDQIVSTLVEEEGSNSLILVATDEYENILEIDAKSDINTKNMLLQTPSLTLHEESRMVSLENTQDENESPTYFVYGMHEVEGIFTKPAEAISLAYNAPGVVVNNSGNYVWIKGNLLTKNQIMDITYAAEDYENMTTTDSTVVCLNLMLQNEGVSRNVQEMLDGGNSVTDILSTALPDYDILNLQGCEMDAMLYYINQDIPVLASLSDGTSVLIIGFNELNTVLMDPRSGTVYKLGMNDSRTLFSTAGNKFITYLK
ncbi:MAG: hypothetical protein K6F97_03485 [Lachnospiraceae bacterium]|nr:hypothetical protein [Lachnospiraceae bacterium]